MKLLTFCIVSMFFLAAGNTWAGVNINTASASELAQELKNIGPAKAAAIVEYRKMHGVFKSVDQLAEVHGIGKATLEMNRDLIVLSDPKSGVESGTGKNSGVKPGAGNPGDSDVAASRKLEQLKQ